MPTPHHFLSFGTDQDGSQVFIHADRAGLDHLIGSLTALREQLDAGVCDHDHMMTDAWGGNELTEKVLDPDARTVHHVTIHGWTPERMETHGLRAAPGASPHGGTTEPLGDSDAG